MFDSRAALEAVVRHAVELEDDYDEIAPTLASLQACGDTILVPLLQQALARFLDEKNFYGRDLIAGVLAGIQKVAALPVLLGAAARDLGDDQDSLQAEIIDLLGTDRDASRRIVLESVTSDTAEVRRVALWALGFVVEAEDLDLLAAAAADTDPTVRSIAVGSVPDPAGDDRAFRLLVLALRDRDERVRVSAVSRLGYTGRADAVTPLVAVAADPAARVRSMTAYTLGRLGVREATPTLQRLLQDPDQHVREEAGEALGSVGGPAAVTTLLTMAAAADPRLRARAATSLAKAVDSDPRVRPQLAVLARDDEAVVRAATISGLAGAGVGSSEWGQLLAEVADDRDPMVRQRVAVLVRRLAPDAAPEILHRYTTDPDPTLRRLAATELGRLAEPNAADAGHGRGGADEQR
ncbi:HEAT repeat domain-containing protein [Micromonospora sp. NPDC049580]|uniref:HEAT repeat domain-containing protein n=1 Tax=Micromonospora sp. NPDC049580 TaxID=3154832 RepID=UPI0034314123